MKVLNALSRNDTEHGVYYYLASAVDAELAKRDAEIRALKSSIAAAVLREREACAKVCEDMAYTNPQRHQFAYAIRARGQV